MTKLISTALIGLSALVSAQVSFAGKAHLLFPTSSGSWKSLKDAGLKAYDKKGSNSVGYNVGVSAKVDLPGAFYVMPELYFTSFKNEFTDENTKTSLKAKSNRIDVPVLVGYKLLGDTASLFLGPVASYNLSTKESYQNFKEHATKDFTVGYQFGAQVQLSDFIINARYEGAFSNDQRNFIDKHVVSGQEYEVQYDARPNLFMVGVGYKF